MYDRNRRYQEPRDPYRAQDYNDNRGYGGYDRDRYKYSYDRYDRTYDNRYDDPYDSNDRYQYNYDRPGSYGRRYEYDNRQDRDR